MKNNKVTNEYFAGNIHEREYETNLGIRARLYATAKVPEYSEHLERMERRGKLTNPMHSKRFEWLEARAEYLKFPPETDTYLDEK